MAVSPPVWQGKSTYSRRFPGGGRTQQQISKAPRD